jgi:hypothetical protein
MSMADATTAVAEVGSPAWWLTRLIERLAVQADAAEELDAYYQGDQGIPVHANRAVSDAYRRLMTVAPTNFAMLIVEAIRERMVVGGFRTGAVNDPNGDACSANRRANSRVSCRSSTGSTTRSSLAWRSPPFRRSASAPSRACRRSGPTAPRSTTTTSSPPTRARSGSSRRPPRSGSPGSWTSTRSARRSATTSSTSPPCPACPCTTSSPSTSPPRASKPSAASRPANPGNRSCRSPSRSSATRNAPTAPTWRSSGTPSSAPRSTSGRRRPARPWPVV